MHGVPPRLTLSLVVVVVAPVVAHVVISHRRHDATPRVAVAAAHVIVAHLRRSPASLTCVATATAHVIVAHRTAPPSRYRLKR